jgi:hypothetical protein
MLGSLKWIKSIGFLPEERKIYTYKKANNEGKISNIDSYLILFQIFCFLDSILFILLHEYYVTNVKCFYCGWIDSNFDKGQLKSGLFLPEGQMSLWRAPPWSSGTKPVLQPVHIVLVGCMLSLYKNQ